MIINYLSLYHGYLVVFIKKNSFERIGNNYDIHEKDEYKNKPLEYRFLKLKNIHKLPHYNLVEKKSCIYDSTFILKPNVCTYKMGATIDSSCIDCVKIF